MRATLKLNVKKYQYRANSEHAGKWGSRLEVTCDDHPEINEGFNMAPCETEAELNEKIKKATDTLMTMLGGKLVD